MKKKMQQFFKFLIYAHLKILIKDHVYNVNFTLSLNSDSRGENKVRHSDEQPNLI